MAQKRNPKQVRLVIGLIFALFLMINAVLNTVAVVAGLKSSDPLIALPGDSSPAVRLVLFVIGAGLSWLLGRMLYGFLISGEIPVAESVNYAYILLFYFLLIFAALAFLGVLSWMFLFILFLVLLLFSVFTLWRLLGGVFTVGSVLAASIAAAVTFYLIR